MKSIISSACSGLLTSVCFLSFFTGVKAQNFKEDMQRMASAYAEYKDIGVNIETQVYYRNQSKQANSYKGFVQKSEGKYYYKMQDTEMLINQEFLILVNNKLRNIVYRPMSKEEASVLIEKYDNIRPDSLSLQYDSVSYLGMKEEKKSYELYSHKNDIERTRLTFNTKNGLLQQLVYFYKVKNDLYKVEMNFDYRFELVNQQLLQTAAFLVKEGRAYKPQARFAQYTVHKFDPNEQ